MQPWVILLIVLACLLLLYILSGRIVKILLRKAKKKAIDALDSLAGYEQDRLDRLIKIKDELVNDHKFLPKNRLDAFEETKAIFLSVPSDVAKAKGQNDFLVLYLRKFLKEKRLLAQGKYKDRDMRLEGEVHIDPSDRKSPYYSYNRKALKYNALRNRTFFSLFTNNGNNPSAPIL